MPDFSTRSDSVELMDDLECTGEVLEQTLRELEFINKWLGGNKITIDAIEKLLATSKRREFTIADLGCGGGAMLKLIHSWGCKRGLKLRLIGIDANPNVIALAKKNLNGLPEIHLQALNIFSNDFQQQKYDIIIGTLFYHHFPDSQLSKFFERLNQQVSIGYVINDIHRHWFAYYSIKILTQIFSRSSMVKYDAPLSVLRAFKKRELERILPAKPYNVSIRWKWAFRWQVIAKMRLGDTLAL